MHNSLAVKLVKYSVRYTKVSIPKRTFYLIKSEMSLHLLDTPKVLIAVKSTSVKTLKV